MPQLSLDLNAQQNKVEQKGFIAMVRPIHLQSELKTYFDYDLIADGILPIQIHVTNKAYGKTCLLNTAGINLVNSTGARAPTLSMDQLMDKTKKSQWRSAGWGLALGLIGAIPSLINVSNTNDKIRADYEARLLKGGNIVPGAVTEGMMFFSIPPDISDLNGWKVTMIIVDPSDSKSFDVECGLAGTVVPRPKPVQEETNEEKKVF
jgi:hypothetical protein